MNILWITNILFPEVYSKLANRSELKASGGWLLGSAETLSHRENIKLFVATVSNVVNKLTIVDGNVITYFILPYGKGNILYNSEYEKYWREVNEKVRPDVVHIHGTEYTHGLAYVRACGKEHVVVSIQGLISRIANAYFGGYSCFEIFKNLTIHDVLRGNSLFKQRSQFVKRGKFELELLQEVKHVIGRTEWDKTNALAINPQLIYHFNNEALRSSFYSSPKWEYSKCSKHTIFISQCSYPLKGLHILFRALHQIFKEYPDTLVRVAGVDITCYSSIKEKLCISGYGKILRNLIKRYNLQDHVVFTGQLDESEMIREYLNCNVFVCPSLIENSSNSLCEAQLLGVPCIASNVGGIPSLVEMNKTGFLYDFHDYTMLAHLVINQFSNFHILDLSHQVEIASQRHNRNAIISDLVDIYKDL